MSDLSAVRVIVSGQVWGLFSPIFAQEQARRLNLTSYSGNVPGRIQVEVLAEEPPPNLEWLIALLKTGAPVVESHCSAVPL
jgi:acylphosphatase